MSDNIVGDFTSKFECEAQLGNELALDPAGGEVPAGLLGAFVRECEVPLDPNAPRSLFEARVGRWVIRDDDLKLFGSVKDAVLPFAAIGFLLDSMTTGGIGTVTFAALQVARNARHYGVWLTPRQLQVVIALEKHERKLSKTDLLRALPGNWTMTDLDTELKALKGLPSRNGAVKVVDEIAGGTLILNGI